MSKTALNHPTAEELRALTLGQLTEAELDRVSAHLGACAECCCRVDQLPVDDPLLARLQQSVARPDEMLVNQAQRRSAVRALRQGPEAGAAATRQSPAAAPVVPPPPRAVGEYDILAEIGRGGMGVVYKAWHRGLNRPAALKMVLAGEFASPVQEVRFRLEAELAARVRHPNIVQVYEIGTHTGRPFLAMEWVEGGSLANRLDGTPWPPGEAAALVESLARAIHVAHAEGVVHRDLKPANILLQTAENRGQQTEDESQKEVCLPARQLNSVLGPLSSVCPKITDFGLAQPAEGGTTLTQSGMLVGTPGYMAPEQAGGKRALVGPATDIYALGVILYQLLTGRLPFRGDTTLEVLRAVTSDEPMRPRRLQPRLPRDLEAITLHCLEKDPRHRYASALALAEDLERFREGKQVSARPVGSAARLARACRRRPVITLLVILLTASLFGGLAGVTWKWLEANEQRDLADVTSRQANDEKREALFQAYCARLAAAGAALQNHDVVDAAGQLKAVPEYLRGWEWGHLQSRLDDSAAAIALPVGLDGYLIAGTGRLRIGVWSEAGLRVTGLDGDESVTVPIAPVRGQHYYATQTRRGLRVASWHGNSTIDLLDEAGRAVCRVDVPGRDEPSPVVVSPDGTRLACARPDSGWVRLKVFDAKSGKQTVVCDGHRDGLWDFAFSPDGTRLATVGDDRTACLWDPISGALLATCHGHVSRVLGLAFRPDGTRLVTTSSDGTVRQWDAVTGREVEPPYERHSGEVAAAAYSPDGQWIASAGSDRTVRVWRAAGRQDLAVLHGHTGPVTRIAFAPDGRRLASLSSERGIGWARDDTVRVWDVDPGATLPVLRGHTSYVYPVAYSPDGRWIASGGWDNTVRLWDAATGEPCATLPHPGVVPSLTYSSDGRWLITCNYGDERLRIWDVATARVHREIQGPGRAIRFLTLSPDGRRLAVTANDPQGGFYWRVCDLQSGEWLHSAKGVALVYSPDGRQLAVRGVDGTSVLLVDAQTNEPVKLLSGHEGEVHWAAFSPDGRILASFGKDRTVRLWQIESGACRVLYGHTEGVFAAAFHPDGKRLATAGRDRVVWLWDLARGVDVARLQGHTSYVWSLAFSPDGTTLASGSGDATVRLWDTAPLKERYQARREAAALRLEAEQLVEILWQTKLDAAEVVAAVRADAALDDSLRQAALRAVLRRAQPPVPPPGLREPP